MRVLDVCVVLAALTCVSCQHTTVPLAQSSAPPPSMSSLWYASQHWRRFEAPHFVVRTSMPEGAAMRAAAALEEIRLGLIAVAWPRFSFAEHEPQDVFVLSADEFDDYFSQPYNLDAIVGANAWFVRGPRERWDLRAARSGDASILRRLIADGLAREVYRQRPTWFAVGLNRFLETVYLGADERAVVVGAINSSALTAYRLSPEFRIREVLDATSAVEHSIDFEGKSWVLVHWLYNTRQSAFATYQLDLANGVDPKAALDNAFPKLDLDQVEQEIGQYATNGTYQETPVAFATLARAAAPFGEVDVQERELHVVRARIAMVASRYNGSRFWHDQLQKEIAEGVALDPTDPLPMTLDRWTPPSELLGRARRSAQARPRDPDAWLLLARISVKGGGDPKETEDALRRVLALSPNHAEALNDLAWMLLEASRSGEALPLAIRAAKFRREVPTILDTLARAYFETGRCEDALRTQWRAVDQLALFDPETLLPEMRRRLDRYQRGCWKRPSAP